MEVAELVRDRRRELVVVHEVNQSAAHLDRTLRPRPCSGLGARRERDFDPRDAEPRRGLIEAVEAHSISVTVALGQCWQRGPEAVAAECREQQREKQQALAHAALSTGRAVRRAARAQAVRSPLPPRWAAVHASRAP
jgi:hypothetical protein